MILDKEVMFEQRFIVVFCSYKRIFPSNFYLYTEITLHKNDSEPFLLGINLLTSCCSVQQFIITSSFSVYKSFHTLGKFFNNTFTGTILLHGYDIIFDLEHSNQVVISVVQTNEHKPSFHFSLLIFLYHVS